MKGLGKLLLNAFYPNHCLFCHQVLLPRQRICEECASRAPYILPPVCERCGRNGEECLCQGHHHSYERCISPFYHQGLARDAIVSLKTELDMVVVEGFAAEMAEVVRREYGGIAFERVVSVPMHRKDYRRRGFDQAAELARALARQMAVPYTSVLVKLEETAPQKELTAVRRRGNLLGVFDVTQDVTGQTILLVDDVTTTGSTLEECAKMLKIFGAEEVYAVTAAATVLSKEEK